MVSVIGQGMRQQRYGLRCGIVLLSVNPHSKSKNKSDHNPIHRYRRM